MSSIPTYALRPSFLATPHDSRDAPVCVAGLPFDLGTTFRAGARFGPEAVRRASRMLCDGANPASWRDPLALGLADLGDFALPLGDIAGSLAAAQQQAAGLAHLVALGGDHTMTLALLRALAQRRGGPVALVHFDAHLDTWPDNFGASLAHGSVFWHALHEGLVDPRRMIQVGIRSPVQREVWDWTMGQGVRIVSAEQAHLLGPAGLAQAIRDTIGDAEAYLSFDIDAIDPSQAPGTGTPEIGGLFTWQVVATLRRLAGLRFVGMDVMEVAPAYDSAEITALAAATVVWEYLSLLGEAR